MERMSTRSGAITIEALESILDRKLKPLTDQLEGLAASVHFMSDKYDEVTKEMERLQLQADTAVEENKQLKAEVFSLRNKLEIQKGITNNPEQYTRRNCLEIAGIPEREGKDTK